MENGTNASTRGRHQSDSVGLDSGNNSYVYAGQAPTLLTDPEGLLIPAAAVPYAKCIVECMAVEGAMAKLMGDPCYTFGGAAGDCSVSCLNPVNWLDPIKMLGMAAKSLGVNPFKGKAAREVAEMFEKKGYQSRGPDPVGGQGTYVNPRTGRGYHIDARHPEPKGPHVGLAMDVQQRKTEHGARRHHPQAEAGDGRLTVFHF